MAPLKKYVTFGVLDRKRCILLGFLRIAGNGVSVEGGRGEVNLPPVVGVLTRTTRSADFVCRGPFGVLSWRASSAVEARFASSL